MKTNNEIKIDVPEGMEAYLEDNVIKFKPIKKKLTYDDIAKELFLNKDIIFSDIQGIPAKTKSDYSTYNHLNNCTSKKQAQKLVAINQLMNVAKYLNGDWKPYFKNTLSYNYYIYCYDNDLGISNTSTHNGYIVYFKSVELAQQAIDILGEETIKLALSTDW